MEESSIYEWFDLTEKASAPLIVFIHVPKTTGSTVNAYLKRSGARGASHVEAWIDDSTITAAKLLELDWVSGHVPFSKMLARIRAQSSRPVLPFTLLRDPIKQLISHYNWLIEIYHRRGRFYEGHPDHIKEISESIRKSDNTSPSQVITQLKAFSRLFLNQQSRIVLSSHSKTLTNAEFTEGLKAYEMVATEGQFSHLIYQMTGRAENGRIRKNVSKYHFDPSVFESAELRAFLAENHAADIALYRYVVERNKELYPMTNTLQRTSWLRAGWHRAGNRGAI